ncbi:hypothetical protein, partial [Escherichia coli]|uniref:hypothetical protein n=1 Tax=Escherichia coli TaxID=562 RepID=UPI003D17FE4D
FQLVTPTFTRPFHPSHSPEPAEIQAADLSGHRNGESGGCRIVVLLRHGNNSYCYWWYQYLLLLIDVF